MKTLMNKLAIPFLALLFVNMIGAAYHFNYEGCVVGSVVGMIVGFLASEIRAKFD
jgi:glucose-6-phosphate-specific signal transduction histidine kinase